VPRDLKIRGYTVGQFPNPPLWVAFVALIFAWLTSEGSTVNDIARAVLYVSFAVWAWEEATRGVNGLRRALGVGGLVLVVVLVARALG
jgi:hypothetical protein